MAPQTRHNLPSSCRTFIGVAIVVGSLCCQGTRGFMTPRMVHRTVAANRPPLEPHIDGPVSTQCEEDVANLLTSPDLITVLDAIGKPQAGILAGNLAWLGHYDECSSITSFKYCLSYLSMSLSEATPYAGAEILWGLCVPESCSETDIISSLYKILAVIEAPFNTTAVNASSVVCAQHPPAPYNTGFFVTILIVTLIGILMLFGAFLDTTLRSVDYKPPPRSEHLTANRVGRVPEPYPYGTGEGEGRIVQETTDQNQGRELEEKPTECSRAWHQFLLCFAVNRNVAKLMNARSGEGSIGCLNGIRVISMSWVILGHITVFVMGTGILGNTLFGFNMTSQFGFQVIANAFFSVDSFFFLSGLLLAYMALGRMVKSGGSIPWPWFYFHRYWRLTPALGMTMLISLFIKPHFGDGPLWHLSVSDPYCSKYWWTNLLYINNFYEGNCIGWVWYLANDMQFFIISPFILILLYKLPVLGMLSMLGMTIASITATAILMVKYNFSSVAMDAFDTNQDPNHSFMEVIYEKPYCRITPYLVGMAMGYFLHRHRNHSFKLHPTVVAAGWAIATAIAMSVIYGLYGSYHGNALSTAGNAAFMALSKIGWAVSLSWVVFACRYGYGGLINDFLSWDVWIPLSRLTYSAYLLHPIIIFSYYFNMKNNYFYSLYILAFEFAGIFILAYAAAVVMALFIEFPLGNMEKFFMPTNYKKKN